MEQARYTFLGWFRRGLVGLADGQVDDTGRLKIPLELDVVAEGRAARSEIVRPNVTTHGPGDVTGVDPSAIIRVVPANGVRDFESNFFCAIEFYDEDFPWRFTPSASNAQALAPWLWVVALADGEWRSPAPSILEVTAAARVALPDTATTSAWAHVQLDSALADGDVAAARLATRQLLDANPNTGCSRLVCPRRLAPATHYTAFLVPAFERGRLAGLGHAARDIDAVAHDQPAWTASGGALALPVYHQWEFSTSTVGDFEDLARALKAVPSQDLGGDVLVDIQEPGWNVHHRSATADRPQPGAVALPTAVRVEGSPSPLAFGTDDADAALAEKLRALLSVDAGDDDDPFVQPPRYGSGYRAAALCAPGETWYEQVNLDPAFRAIAGQGAAAVRDRQDAYLDRIWDRLRHAFETLADTRRWQFSLEVSTQLFAKRLAPLLAIAATPTTDAAELSHRDSRMFRALAIAAPMHAKIDIAGATMTTALKTIPFASTLSGGFTKVTRRGGPLMRRLETAAPRIRHLFEPLILVRPPRSALRDALDAVAAVAGQPAFDSAMRQAGLGTGATVATAVAALRERLAPVELTTIVAKPVELVTALRAQLEPRRTIPLRMRAQLQLAPPPTDEAAQRIDLPTFDVELPDPMYATLAQRPELLVPALDKLPQNSATMLEPDPRFIDAFMLGANHEITRELLWREVPIPLDTTIFRQFWDVRDNPSAAAEPQAFRDIVPITGWGATGLGAAEHRPPSMRGALTVVVIRGELFRKYPHAEVFMQPAAWVDIAGRRVRREAKTAAVQPPLFSARIAPDITLVGFQLAAADAIGDSDPAVSKPGWYFVLKERAGDVHFGLDLKPSASDPSWAGLTDVPVGGCVDPRTASFRALPRSGATADQIAAMLYQRPFTMFVHASRLLHRR
ncbi:hypothetical protein BH11MYX3_BH11MYX3_14280 [soil metagenome]